MKLKLALIIFFFINSSNLYSQSDLIGCYQLDNNPNDLSGNNNHGVAYNLGPATDRFGNPNQAYNFSGLNSAILIDVTDYRLNNYTYSVWCNPSNLPSQGNYFSILALGGNIADQSVLIGNNQSLGHVGFGFGSWDSIPSPHHCYSGSLPNIGQWYHIVVTRDNDTMKLFIDDTLICFQATGNNAGYIGSSNVFSIGSRIDTLSQNFIGDIDEIKMIDRVLTIPEIMVIDSTCTLFTGIFANGSEQQSLFVYPNPTNTTIEVHWNSKSAFNRLYLINEMGQNVYECEVSFLNHMLINTEGLASGIYFIKIVSDSNFVYEKLVIN